MQSVDYTIWTEFKSILPASEISAPLPFDIYYFQVS